MGKERGREGKTEERECSRHVLCPKEPQSGEAATERLAAHLMEAAVMGRGDGDRGGLWGHRRRSTRPLEVEGQGDLPEGVTPDLNL